MLKSVSPILGSKLWTASFQLFASQHASERSVKIKRWLLGLPLKFCRITIFQEEIHHFPGDMDVS
jgi:hypothetical protein